MSTIIPKPLSGWTTPAYLGRASIKLPTGPTYHEIALRSNLRADQILWVNLKLGTDTIVRVKGTDLIMLDRYKKIYETQPGDGTGTDAENEIIIRFADIANLGVESRNFTALVTDPSEQLELEIEIGAAAAGAPAIKLELHSEISVRDPRGRRWLPKLLRGSYDATSTQDNNFSGLTRGKNRYYRRVHFEQPLVNLRVVKDDVQKYERPFGRNVAHLKQNARAPQPGYYHWDEIASDFGRMDMFRADAERALELFIDVAAPVTIPMLIESVDDLHPEWDNAA